MMNTLTDTDDKIVFDNISRKSQLVRFLRPININELPSKENEIRKIFLLAWEAYRKASEIFKSRMPLNYS